MMHSISTPRNKACADMIHRIENPSSAETLDIKIRADQILNERRSEQFKADLTHCLTKRLPFILYEDETKFKHGNYYVIIPSAMKMLCYMDRTLKAETTSTTVDSFANNVHIAIAAYDKIWIPSQNKKVGEAYTGLLITSTT
jgi:hypothetical protein